MNESIGSFLNQREHEGCLLGLEVESEGYDIDDLNPRELNYWDIVADDSLRNGVEYRFNKPYGIDDTIAAIHELYTFDPLVYSEASVRTSIHVHINVLDLSVTQLKNILRWYILYEYSLVKMAGEYRSEWYYSRPLYKTELTFRALSEYLQGMIHIGDLVSDWPRYSGLNLNSLTRHGTIEFRHHQLTLSRRELTDWVWVITKLRGLSDYTPDVDSIPFDLESMLREYDSDFDRSKSYGLVNLMAAHERQNTARTRSRVATWSEMINQPFPTSDDEDDEEEIYEEHEEEIEE